MASQLVYVWRKSHFGKKLHVFLKTSHGLSSLPMCTLFSCNDHLKKKAPKCKSCLNIMKYFKEESYPVTIDPDD